MDGLSGVWSRLREAGQEPERAPSAEAGARFLATFAAHNREVFFGRSILKALSHLIEIDDYGERRMTCKGPGLSPEVPAPTAFLPLLGSCMISPEFALTWPGSGRLFAAVAVLKVITSVGENVREEAPGLAR